MKESTIKRQAVKELEKEGWYVWCPDRKASFVNGRRVYPRQDIAEIWDAVAFRGRELRFIQWTTYSNISARKKKILDQFTDKNFYQPCEIWGLKEDKTWRKINL